VGSEQKSGITRRSILLQFLLRESLSALVAPVSLLDSATASPAIDLLSLAVWILAPS
jgi:hypothetical protein